MTLPLAGIRVIELAEQGFVPSAAAVLADWGAEVTKIERPEGDGLRAVMASGLVADTGDIDFLWEQVNRNKRGLCLDLAAPGGRDLLLRLVAIADVFITNQLPRVVRKFSIEPADLHAVNPRLVYARGHGQGTAGPDAEAGGYDAVSYFSRSGLAHMLTPAGGPLVMQRPAMGDVPSGAMLAGGVAAALLRRERTGEGGVVDLSLLASGCWTLSPDLVATSILGTEPHTIDPLAGLPNPLIGVHVTSDGRYLMLNMLQPDKYWEPCCRALGADELLAEPGLADEAGRTEHSDEIRARFAALIGARPLRHWVERLSEAGCVFSTIANPPEVLDDRQVEANGYLPRHPTHDRARLVASPVQFDETPVAIRRRAPERGEHTDAVLADYGLDAESISKARAQGAVS